MPVPIRPIINVDKGDSRSTFDYSFLADAYVNSLSAPSKTHKLAASNNDAELLFKIWQVSEKREDGSLCIDGCDITSSEILRLKSRGILSGGVTDINLTKKGKAMITVLALSEPNRFEKNSKEKSYREILANMDKKNKGGYRIPKFASNNNNNIRL